MIDPAMKRFASAAEPQPMMNRQTGEYPPVSMQPEQRQPFSQSPSFAGRMNAQEGAAAPYAQQQAGHNPFQRPRPTFQSQQQEEPFRRAAGGQYASRPTEAYPASF